MIASWRTVRVFISSTFRDMHAERDHLVKVTFPRLREWCEARRLHLVDIDLRWGVTKEEADNGKAIEICLQEIDGSRPFFVCLLGDRYGWVPQDLPAEERYLFRGLQAESGLSITHLEILHAALEPVRRLDGRREDVCSQAFFYFRDLGCLPAPESLTGLSAEQRAEYAEAFFEADPARRSLLDRLKQEIRRRYEADGRVATYRGVWDPAADNPEDAALTGRLTRLDEFARRVEADLQRAIEARFAEHLAGLGGRDRFEEERALHEAFIENRTQVHVARRDVEAELTAYADGDDPRVLVLSGPPGSGKSAILSHWVRQRLGSQGEGRGEECLVARFVGASPASTSPPGLLAGVCEELRRRFELTEEVEEAGGPAGPADHPPPRRRVTQPMQVSADPVEILNKWPRFLEACGAKGRAVIVLDAVNQLERGADPRRAYWIPRRLPPGVRLILSALDHGAASRPEGAAGEGPADWLAELRRREIQELPVPDLSDDDRLRIIRELPSVFCKTLDADQVRLLLANPATRNPLFLTVALEELRVFGSFEALPLAIARLPQLGAPEIAGDIDQALDRLFRQVLDRLDRESGRVTPGLVPALLSLLACSRDGLSEPELGGLLARVLTALDPADRAGQTQVVLRQVRPYLQRKGAQGTVLVDFYHRSLWKAVVGQYAATQAQRGRLHVEIADYFDTLDFFAESLDQQRERARRLPPTPRPVNVRTVVELPWQRLEAAKRLGQDDPRSPYWDQVADLLTNWQFLEAKAEAQG